ncbi:MAG: carbohydrate-binding domain-containing protein [Porphyromonadaceae bacterium]|nr:carbohydrate-binding domain-containing protein [Porphyromonadaceae bacterium]
MKIDKLLIGLLLMMPLFLGSCLKEEVETDDDEDDGTVVDVDYDVDNNFVTNSKDTTIANAITLVYSENSVSITNPLEGSGVAISQANGDVVITSTAASEVNYVVSGSTTDGSLKIYSNVKFGLYLNGASIVSEDGPAVNIQSGKQCLLKLIGSTSNRLIDGKTYTASGEEDMKGALFSEDQLIISGAGNLLVAGRAKHAICSDDYIQIQQGNITVDIAGKDAIHANNYVVIDGGTLNIKSLGDGIESETGYVTINGGDIDITTTAQKGMGIQSEGATTVNSSGTIQMKIAGDGSKGFKTGGNLTIANGTITIATSGDAFYDTEDADISSAAGIKCDGNFVMEKGSVTLASTGSAGKGLNVDGTLTINGGILTVTTAGGKFQYGNDDSAAKAIKSEGNLTINNGSIIVKTSGVEAEGIETKTTLTMNGGTVEVEAYDDCINAKTHIEIAGGKIYCYSTTNDGIDSNGTLSVSGGVIVSSGSTSPEEGFDCDNNTFKITGGTIIGVGGATSSPSSSVSKQYTVVYGGSGTAGQYIHVETSGGTDILTFKIPRSYSQMTMLFSNSALAASTSYTIYKDGSVSGGSDFHGLYTGSAYTKGTSASTFTTSSIITTVGTTSGGMGGGGRF